MHKLDIELNPSRTFISFALAILGLSILVIFKLPVPFWLKVLFLFVIFLYGFHLIWVEGFFNSQNSILQVSIKESGPWLFHSRAGHFEGYLKNDSLVTRWLCILRIKGEQKIANQTCVIFHDSVQQDLYRQLLMRLRCYR